MGETDMRMTQIARSFPTLRRAPGVEPWDPVALDAWGISPAPSAGGLHAARFMLALWDSRRPWWCGRFNFHAALNVWDSEHRAALQKWLANPWWP